MYHRIMLQKPPFLIKCYCGGPMRRTSLKHAGKAQLQEYECPVCKNQISLTPRMGDGDEEWLPGD